jgi:hypothetical protein
MNGMNFEDQKTITLWTSDFNSKTEESPKDILNSLDGMETINYVLSGLNAIIAMFCSFSLASICYWYPYVGRQYNLLV